MTAEPVHSGDGAHFVRRWLDDVDPRSPVPLYDQIATRLKALVASGGLADGDPLPSVRQLAGGLRVNPATVARAYRTLEADGFADMRQGAGSFVRVPAAAGRERERLAQARRLVRDLLSQAGRLGVEARTLRRALDELLEDVR